MSRFAAPGWRLAGSFVSWTAFTFFFLGLYQAAGLVIGLGGFCASGGPYVIETECPDSVILFAPGGIFGMIAAVAVAIFFARGFGVSLLSWAWPILFVGLGIQFLLGAVSGIGIVSNIICAVLFIAMGLAPIWFTVSSKLLASTLLGSTNLMGQHFVSESTPRPYLGVPRRPDDAEQVPATTGDWALSLGLCAVAIALGAYLSYAAFTALAATPA